MKYHFIFAVGFFLIIIPFIGIPTSWKMVIIGLIGAALMVVALIRYYVAYSALESNQSHVDGGPDMNNDSAQENEGGGDNNDNSTDGVRDEKIQTYTSSVQPSPYYTPSDRPTRVDSRIESESKVIKSKIRRRRDDEDVSSDEDDDFEDASYITKNKYEEEHAF